jgi:hypothetical protein
VTLNVLYLLYHLCQAARCEYYTISEPLDFYNCSKIFCICQEFIKILFYFIQFLIQADSYSTLQEHTLCYARSGARLKQGQDLAKGIV